MDREQFLESLLEVMETKSHWGWPGFTSGLVLKERLHIHFEQEYETYVRDFPVLIGRAYIQCPVPEARRELAENLYEEETGGLVAGRPHPELFLEYPRGLGFDLRRFEQIQLLAGAREFRNYLDEATKNRGWSVAAGVTTLFLEGTKYERGEVDKDAPKRPTPALSEHPLCKHYGLDQEFLALTKAHRAVEGSHRGAAWEIMLNHVPAADRLLVVEGIKEACAYWKAYRDEVSIACGLTRPA